MTRPGFKRGRKLHKNGSPQPGYGRAFFLQRHDSHRKPPGGKRGRGFSCLWKKLQQERLITAIIAVAAAEFMVDWTLNYTRDDHKSRHLCQAAQFALVEMATEVRLGRTFVDKLIVDHMEKKNVIVETSMAKYWTTEMVKRLADRALDLAGEPAMLETCPMVRSFRDLRVMSIFAGTNEIMKGITAKFMGL